MNTLQIRLMNCLQLIIDLEPAMSKLYRVSFKDDFARLEAYLKGIDKLELAEEDIIKMEKLTASFLKEARYNQNSLIPAGRLQ